VIRGVREPRFHCILSARSPYLLLLTQAKRIFMSELKTQQAVSHIAVALCFYLYIRNILARVHLAVLREVEQCLCELDPADL
jgi:hypothetical protein